MLKNIIDTHVHIWDIEKINYDWLKNDTSILNRNYFIGEIAPLLPLANVNSGILVQAANNSEDTDWILQVAAETEWVKGVVGWLPLSDPRQTEKLIAEKYGKNEYFKGCRHLIHNEPDPKWLLRENVLESLKILAGNNIPYDVVGVNDSHMKTVLKLFEKLPELKVVLDHLNQPPVRRKERFGRWGELMREISGHKNAYAKISGLGTVAGKDNDWNKESLKPYIMFAISAFGTDRCFCGGDWPVALLAGPYEKAWLIYQQVLSEELDSVQQEKVLYKNAGMFYNLSQDQ